EVRLEVPDAVGQVCCRLAPVNRVVALQDARELIEARLSRNAGNTARADLREPVAKERLGDLLVSGTCRLPNDLPTMCVAEPPRLTAPIHPADAGHVPNSCEGVELG